MRSNAAARLIHIGVPYGNPVVGKSSRAATLDALNEQLLPCCNCAWWSQPC